jgi:hypothetical protein
VARSSYGFAVLPGLYFVVACATGVNHDFVNDGEGADTGGSQSSSQGGLSGSAGQSPATGGQLNGGAGKPAYAFGGTGSGGAAGASGTAGATSAGGQGGMPSSGAAGAGGTASGGTTAGAGTGGKASGGAGGASSSAGMGGTSGTSGAGTAGSAGSAGSGGSSGSTGACAPAGTDWVVQYWTGSAAANMPTGDVRIFNNAGGTVNFNTLELRHYFTNEETATLSFVFPSFGHTLTGAPYYEDEGGANVLGSINNLTATNASHYLSIKFNATPGNFGNGETAQLGYYGSLSMYPMKSNQANDYTYVGHPTSDPGGANKNTGWNRITLYVGGKLMWGCEP